jgi:hypothetical protein
MSARVEEVKKGLFELWDRVRAEVLGEECDYPRLCVLAVKHNGEEVDRIDDTEYVVELPGGRGYLILDAENLGDLSYGETLREAYMGYLRRLLISEGENIGFALAHEKEYSDEWLKDELEASRRIVEDLLKLYTLAREGKLEFELKEVE